MRFLLRTLNPSSIKGEGGRPEKRLVGNYYEKYNLSGRRLLLRRRAKPLKKFSLFIFLIIIPTKNYFLLPHQFQNVDHDVGSNFTQTIIIIESPGTSLTYLVYYQIMLICIVYKN